MALFINLALLVVYFTQVSCKEGWKSVLASIVCVWWIFGMFGNEAGCIHWIPSEKNGQKIGG